MEFEQYCKVFAISPEPDSIPSLQKINSDLVGGHYIFPGRLHFTESTVPHSTQTWGTEYHFAYKYPFFYNGVSGTWTEYGV